jgi:hypothetical protein
VRRNEQLWQTLDIGNMSGPTSGFKNNSNFNLRNEITQEVVVLLIAIFLHIMFFCIALYFSRSGVESLKLLVMGAFYSNCEGPWLSPNGCTSYSNDMICWNLRQSLPLGGGLNANYDRP